MVKSCMGAALLVLLAVAPCAAAQNANTDWPAIGQRCRQHKIFSAEANHAREREQVETRVDL